jgi:phosphoserine phosphatase
MSEHNLAIFDLDGTITRHDTLAPFIAGFLWRHPWRMWRWVPCLEPLLRYALGLLQTGVYAEALECISAHRRNHHHLVLLSASPDLYAPEIAQSLGFDACICTEVRWRSDERLDGSLSSANRRGAEKARCVGVLLAEHQPLLSYAYGNSPADLEHLQMVSAGTYVNGSPAELVHLPNVRAVRWSRPGSAVYAA